MMLIGDYTNPFLKFRVLFYIMRKVKCIACNSQCHVTALKTLEHTNLVLRLLMWCTQMAAE
jgi:hypothetical protein